MALAVCRRTAAELPLAPTRMAIAASGQHERLVPPPLGVWTTATTSSAVRLTLALGDELPALEGDLRERLAQGQQSEDYQVVRPSDPRRFEDLAALAVVARHGGGRAIIAL